MKITLCDADKHQIIAFDADVSADEWRNVVSPPFPADCTVAYIQVDEWPPIGPDLIPPFNVKEGQKITILMRNFQPARIEAPALETESTPEASDLYLCRRYFPRQ